MKILIVDDDLVSLKLSSRILAKKGYPPLEASSVGTALNILESGAPVGLVVSDMTMPEMDGLAFLARLNARPGLKDIPVIMCSAESGRTAVIRSVQAGAKDYVVKPVEAEVLAEKVKNVLQTLPPVLVDRDWMMGRLRMDEETYEEMLDTLMKGAIDALEGVPRHVERGEFEAIRCLAAGLKGGAVSLGAERLHGVLKRLEESAQSGEREPVLDTMIALRREVNILQGVVPHRPSTSPQPENPSPPAEAKPD